MSITSKDEMDFITNNVDSKPIMYQFWIGLEKNPTSGMIGFIN